jgi:hypothetical protein
MLGLEWTQMNASQMVFCGCQRSTRSGTLTAVTLNQGLRTLVRAIAVARSEALQQFELEDLQLWAVFARNGIDFAYVLDRNGFMYLVMPGAMIGKDFGTIERITDKALFIRELYCISGEWVEVLGSLPMTKSAGWNRKSKVVPAPSDRRRDSCP